MKTTLISVCLTVAIAGFLVAAGLLDGDRGADRAVQRASIDVKRCMQRAGHGSRDDVPVNRAAEQAGSAAQTQLDRCWSAASRNPDYAAAHIPDPIAVKRTLRIKGFAAYRCLQAKGWQLAYAVPMSGANGYPLTPSYGDFVDARKQGVGRFYAAAATCTGQPVKSFEVADGHLPADPADGADTCTQHEHQGSGEHSHGCFYASLSTSKIVSTHGKRP